MNEKKKTVGQEAYERMLNEDPYQDVYDTGAEINKEYFDGIEECIRNHQDWDDTWFIVVHHKKERLMENVIRRYFIARRSLPTPQWDQTVWMVEPSSQKVEYLWVLPDETTARWMLANPLDVPKDEYELLHEINLFLDKKLYDQHYHEIYTKRGKTPPT